MAKSKKKSNSMAYAILALVGFVIIIVGCILPCCGAPSVTITTVGKILGTETKNTVELGDNLFQFIIGYDRELPSGTIKHFEGEPALLTSWICLLCAGVLVLVGALASFGKNKKIAAGLNILGGLLSIGASIPFFFYKNFIDLENFSFKGSLVEANVVYSMGAGIILLTIFCIVGGIIATATGCLELKD